jgi:hypothetical protein
MYWFGPRQHTSASRCPLGTRFNFLVLVAPVHRSLAPRDCFALPKRAKGCKYGSIMGKLAK